MEKTSEQILGQWIVERAKTIDDIQGVCCLIMNIKAEQYRRGVVDGAEAHERAVRESRK